MRVYVATQFENNKAAQKMMRRLRGAGHKITYDWTHESQGVSNDMSDASLEQWLYFAQKDAEGVATADVLVVLSVKDGGRGMYTELGIAIANKIPAIIVGPHFNNLFYFMPNCVRVKNTDEAMVLVKALNKNSQRNDKKSDKKKDETEDYFV